MEAERAMKICDIDAVSKASDHPLRLIDFGSLVNIWMWQYGRAFPREYSLKEGVPIRKKQLQESRLIQGQTCCNSSAPA